MKLKQYLFLIILFISISEGFAQLNARLIGNASNQGNNCFVITPDVLNNAGGVWYDNPIDFDSDFTIYYQNYFGNKDVNGADGMALVFKREATPQIGSVGGGIGYQGLTPSLAIEFDTYQNNIPAEGLLGDPTFDHIAIMRNGDPNHNNGSSNLSGPVQAIATNPNIEDGTTHEIKIVWNATTNILEVFFDCQLRLTLNEDIKTTIFSGDDTVYFGFVGSTGGLSNLQSVCFNRISFVDNLQLQDETLCLGEMLNIDATIPSGSTYSWTPTLGVSNPNIPNPTFNPLVTTTYTVTISDVCGDATTEDVTITVLPLETTVFNPIAPICSGDSLTLPTTSTNGVSGTWLPAINNTATTTYTFTPNFGECGTVTTLEVVVNPIISPAFNAIAPICPGDNLSPLPTISNNGILGVWSPALNNMVTTVYTFTPDSGQGCTTAKTLEITVSAITPLFDAVDAICEGDSLNALPTISNEGITGVWSPALNNLVTTMYTFTPDANQCAVETTLQIEVIPIAQLSIEVEFISQPFSKNQSVEAIVTGGDGSYEFQLDSGPWVENNIFEGLSGCENRIIRTRQTSGCSTIASEVFQILDYPRFFTPNGDTFKDNWNIDCLRDQINARISIYDRYGKLITVINPSRSGWDGIYNGTLMPTDDYWFKVDYLNEDGLAREFRSHFTLKR